MLPRLANYQTDIYIRRRLLLVIIRVTLTTEHMEHKCLTYSYICSLIC